jgi:cytochrome c peroxidase
MKPFVIVLSVVFVGVAGWWFWQSRGFSANERAAIESLWIGQISPLLPDPSNRVADEPQAIVLGQRLFFDQHLSVDNSVSCASCHVPSEQFQDNLPLGQGIGTTDRRTMPLANVAYSPWLFWDGRKDSLWSQALAPLESAVEHGGTRTFYAHQIASLYRDEYEALFGPLPDLSDHERFPLHASPLGDTEAQRAWQAMDAADQVAINTIFANLGKSIAAYERQLTLEASRFDQFVEALRAKDSPAMRQLLSKQEQQGLRLFVGKAQCINCHNGPLFSNNEFHNTGVPSTTPLVTDLGRAEGITQALADEFNCLGPYSDAEPSDCAELRFSKVDAHQQERQFRVPSLRNVAERAPYMHAGQFASLDEVLAHYNQAPAAPAGHSELQPLELNQSEIEALIAFLHTLSSPFSTDPALLRAP